MAEYQLTATESCVIRNLDGASIPNDPANRDWVEYQAWLTAGNIPDPAPPPPPPTLPTPDANARITAGVVAALDVAIAVKIAMQNTPDTFNAQNFVAVKIQLDALTEAFAQMLQAQVDPNAPVKPDAPSKPGLELHEVEDDVEDEEEDEAETAKPKPKRSARKRR